MVMTMGGQSDAVRLGPGSVETAQEMAKADGAMPTSYTGCHKYVPI